MKKLTIKHEVYTDVKDLIRINNELGEKAQKGLLIGLRQDKKMLQLAEPAINGIWCLYLNDSGSITKIVLF